jgi:hypothetical protein
MSNKKAIVISVLIAIIVAIIAGMFIMMLFGNVAEATGGGAIVDSMCKFNTAMISKFSEHGRGLLPLMFCPQRTVTIDSTDWDKCNAELYKGDLGYGREKCATQQILILADRCWYMYGEGKQSISGDIIQKSESCFKFKVKNLPKNSNYQLDDYALRTVGDENTNPRTGQKYCAEFSCGDDVDQYGTIVHEGPLQRIGWPIDNDAQGTHLAVKGNQYWVIKYTDSAKSLGAFNILGTVIDALNKKQAPFLFIGTA